MVKVRRQSWNQTGYSNRALRRRLSTLGFYPSDVRNVIETDNRLIINLTDSLGEATVSILRNETEELIRCS